MDMERQPTTSLRPDELLAQSAWMRSLACALVGAEADDLVQETWLRALTNAPATVRDPRAWLARVMRNAARMKGRTATRRREREQRAARAEALPSTADLAAEAELHQLAAQSVLGLEEPYRTTLLLRYVRGLSPTEIAEHQSLSASTVRTRLERGLEQVREHLDRRHGGRREAWVAWLLPNLHRTPSPPKPVGAAAAAGGLLVSTQWIVGGLAIVGVAALLWTALPEGGSGVQPARERASSSAALLEVPAAKVEREPVDSERDAPATTPPVAAPAPAARVDGRVIDEQGRPIESALVWTVDLLRIGESFTATGEPTRTDADGRFRLRRRPQRDLQLMVEHDGHRPAWHGAGRDEPTIEVVLERAAVLEGVVLDRDSGQPLAGTRLNFGDASWREGAFRTVIADSAGRFRFEAAESTGALYFSAAPPGRVYQSVQLDPAPGNLRRVELRLAAGHTLRGRVLDLESGAAIAGASIQAGYQVVATSAANGHFELAGLSGEKLIFEITHPGYSTTARFVDPAALAELELFPLVGACTLSGRVLGPDARPLAGATVVPIHDKTRAGLPPNFEAACPVPDGTVFHRISTLFSALTDSEGRFRFEALSPFMPYSDVSAHAPGLGRVHYGELRFRNPGEQREIEITYPCATGTIEGVVRVGDKPDRAFLRWHGSSAQGKTEADANGRYRLEQVEAGPIRLEVYPNEWREKVELSLVLEPDATLTQDVDIDAPRGRISGRVLRASGEPEPWTVVRARLTDGRQLTTTTEQDGRFDLALDAAVGEGVELELLDHMLWFEQPSAAVGDSGLELRLPDSGVLRVAVTDAHGLPLSFAVDYRRPGEEDWTRLIDPWRREPEVGLVDLLFPAVALDLRFSFARAGCSGTCRNRPGGGSPAGRARSDAHPTPCDGTTRNPLALRRFRSRGVTP